MVDSINTSHLKDDCYTQRIPSEEKNISSLDYKILGFKPLDLSVSSSLEIKAKIIQIECPNEPIQEEEVKGSDSTSKVPLDDIPTGIDQIQDKEIKTPDSLSKEEIIIPPVQQEENDEQKSCWIFSKLDNYFCLAAGLSGAFCGFQLPFFMLQYNKDLNGNLSSITDILKAAQKTAFNTNHQDIYHCLRKDPKIPCPEVALKDIELYLNKPEISPASELFGKTINTLTQVLGLNLWTKSDEVALLDINIINCLDFSVMKLGQNKLNSSEAPFGKMILNNIERKETLTTFKNAWENSDYLTAILNIDKKIAADTIRDLKFGNIYDQNSVYLATIGACIAIVLYSMGSHYLSRAIKKVNKIVHQKIFPKPSIPPLGTWNAQRGG